MNYGFVFPGGEAQTAVDFACLAEAAGWDGFFVWEPIWGVDPWVTLGAIAAKTERIRIGTLLTPPSRRRPWKLASEVVTLDRLSNGRAILSVGLGALDTGFEAFGEATDRKTRAELMDESLDIITGLWSGKQPFTYDGTHYQIKESSWVQPPSLTAPVQSPRIPIWVVGAWPHKKSMRRALRCDGLLPYMKDKEFSADDVRAMKSFVEQERTRTTPFDIIVEGKTPGDDPDQARSIVEPWAAAGATWWIEAMWSATPDPEAVQTRISQGPPPSIG